MKRSTITLSFAALALTAGAALSLAGDPPAVAGKPLDDALAAYKAGEFEKAVEIASKVPAEDAAHAKALYLVGEAELARERWDEAAKAFQAVLDAKKDNVPALTGLGRAQAGKGDAAAAKATLAQAAKLDPKDAQPRRALGETLLAAGETDAAVKELEAATKLDPKDPFTARALVEAHLRKGAPDLASKAAAAFASAAPQSAMAHFLRGLVLDRKGEAKEAIEAYEKAVAADDKFLDAHRNLAVLCTTSNANYATPEKAEKAMLHAKRYIELGGKDKQLKEILDQIQSYLDQMRRGGR
jgi:tetratricopeptide (TPR) repeat protein